MGKNNEIITNDIEQFPEFENIRNAILEAREKVATTVNFAMVAAYLQFTAPSGRHSVLGRPLSETKRPPIF